MQLAYILFSKIKGIKIEKINRGKRGIFTIYSRQEADELHLDYVHWKDVVAHPYALTDDGFVADVIKVRKYKEKGNKHVRSLITLSCGRNFVDRKSRIDYLINKQYNCYSQVKPSTWQEAEAKRDRTKRTVKMYVKQMVKGRVDYNVLGVVYRPDQQVPAATVKRLLKQKEIQQMIDKELEKECERLGLTKGFVLETVQRAIALAESIEDPGNMLKGAAMVASHLGMNRDDKAPEALEFTVTRELGDQIAQIDKELAAMTPVEAKSEVLDE